MWTIIGYVFFKSILRTFNNKNGKGFRFSFDIKDDSGEIRVTAFNDTAKKLFDSIELNQFYAITNASVKLTHPIYKQLNNDFEIIASPFTEFRNVRKKISEVPSFANDFKTIQEIFDLPIRSTCAIIAVISSFEEISYVFRKNSNDKLKKRTLHLVDDSKKTIALTLWGDDAEPKGIEFNCGKILLGIYLIVKY